MNPEVAAQLRLFSEAPRGRSLLDLHERASRTNASNDGRGFQDEIERTAGGYQSRRIATLRKVVPPARVVGSGAARKVIFLANPFLDFVGSWTERNGLAIFVECKSTATHRLKFRSSGGITDAQVAAGDTWRHAGAAVAYLWRFNGAVGMFIPEDLARASALGVASLKFEDARPVPAGVGNIIWDFLPVLAAANRLPEKNSTREAIS